MIFPGNLKPVIRKLGVIMLIILLLSFFLFLYYFKYVPANKELLQQQGFSILNQQANGIVQNKVDLQSYFCTQQQIDSGIPHGVKRISDTSFLVKHPFEYKLIQKGKNKNPAENDCQYPCEPLIQIKLNNENLISFEFNNPCDTFEYIVPLNIITEKVLGSNKSDFFNLILLYVSIMKK